ncbi:ArsR/SmtB family transcription factor [Staphylococcus durrellii]|uniref:ArsR/SmtB family transcription factor n=1 Tax=Staphylococcus durrellii TaxID=2781773 RepID=UPI00189E625A|nr:metalloregulator ArsR/SmtB family transcription factor [Staphylococcus durrellii]MBF7016532.1 winged helix-turn-helix transcriptional regulator [Staphylococcus durrellii]
MTNQFQDLQTETVDAVTTFFKALSDSNRLRIVNLLAQGDCSVGHIAHVLNISQSNVSHQLRILKSANLVKAHRNGQSIIYSIDDTHVSSILNQSINHAAH